VPAKSRAAKVPFSSPTGAELQKFLAMKTGCDFIIGMHSSYTAIFLHDMHHGALGMRVSINSSS
jgi:hypothetical protein